VLNEESLVPSHFDIDLQASVERKHGGTEAYGWTLRGAARSMITVSLNDVALHVDHAHPDNPPVSISIMSTVPLAGMVAESDHSMFNVTTRLDSPRVDFFSRGVWPHPPGKFDAMCV
jgi:hypothetical protein